MKYVGVLLSLALCSCGTTQLTATGGVSDLGSDVKPVSQHTLVGLELSQVPAEGGLGYELGARYGQDSGERLGYNVRSESLEGYAGPRYEWHIKRFSPYLSAGLSYFRMYANVSGVGSDQDSDIGFYGSLGADYELGKGWTIGLAIRRTIDHKGSLFGTAGEVDAWQYLARFGYRF